MIEASGCVVSRNLLEHAMRLSLKCGEFTKASRLLLLKGFGKVIINADSRRVINAILQKDNNGDSDFSIICQICRLMARHDVVKLEHTFREANCIVDELAKVGRTSKNGCKIYEEAPDFLKDILHKDFIGLAISRLVVV